ncbi:UNVERIFIED_CONTAM: hypothetical protein Slati_0446000 [Sesamum latifolium]|uniref:Uncharacterized protein n=1 Tax=Sesamum latifolium TaxID=2727402 RepID=A0AAW2XVP4_9LAMI
MTSPPALGTLHVSSGAHLPSLSATALLQKAAAVGHVSSTMAQLDMQMSTAAAWQKNDRFTRDFLGLAGEQCGGNGNVRELLHFTPYDDDDQALLKHQGFGYGETCTETAWGNCNC